MRKINLQPNSDKRSLINSWMADYHQARMNETVQTVAHLRQAFSHADLTDPNTADLLMDALEDLRDFGNDLEIAMRDELEEKLGLNQPVPEQVVIDGRAEVIEDQDNELEKPAIEIDQGFRLSVPEPMVIDGQAEVVDEEHQDNESNKSAIESE